MLFSPGVCQRDSQLDENHHYDWLHNLQGSGLVQGWLSVLGIEKLTIMSGWCGKKERKSEKRQYNFWFNL